MGVLDGKTALVSGGSRGIGRAIVERLCNDGASIVFSFSDNEAAAEEVMTAVRRAGGHAYGVRADQGRMSELERLFEEADRHLGGLDILVNNAAINPVTSITEATEAGYDRVMAVNAKGPFFAMQMAGRKLRDEGRIISLSTK